MSGFIRIEGEGSRQFGDCPSEVVVVSRLDHVPAVLEAIESTVERPLREAGLLQERLPGQLAFFLEDPGDVLAAGREVVQPLVGMGWVVGHDGGSPSLAADCQSQTPWVGAGLAGDLGRPLSKAMVGSEIANDHV